jgi:hypothetical protein
MPNAHNIKDTKWKKGQSGNPKGRPKKIPDLHSALASVMSEEKDGKTALDALLLRLRAEGFKGNIRAAELLLRYCFPNGIEGAKTHSYELVWGNAAEDEVEDKD